MRSYSVFYIKEEVANYYYGREKMFFQLFADCNQAGGAIKNLLEKQVAYITHDIPKLRIQHLLSVSSSMQRHQKVVKQIHPQVFVIEHNAYQVKMSIEDKKIIIEAHGNFDSESLFLQVLQQFDGALLAIDFENEHFGWLKPKRERKYI